MIGSAVNRVMPPRHRILGIDFFGGTSREAVEEITRTGGLLVAPAAPSLINLCRDADYRRALLASDLAIADSGFMVLLWKFFTGERVPRISGLEHVKRLLEHQSVRQPGAALWVVATEASREKLLDFLALRERTLQDQSPRSQLLAAAESVYIAPKYGRPVEDEPLLQVVRQRRPRHIVIAIGGGIQDKLGQYLLERLDYRPAVHCIGAALGFLTGDQVRIPDWADKYYAGWFFRSLAQPTVFIPRFWSARKLPWLIARYREKLPPMGEQ
ncbi:MAG: WecB/TagA/CpsF family glycosyltransferase [Chthoniobacterales bacterium]|nr:WecB/TagA/CpsF family glycosyltransferase [Chthoniobacterales bacterium]